MRHETYQKLHLKAAEAADLFKIKLGRPDYVQNADEATMALLENLTILVGKATEIVAEVNEELEKDGYQPGE